MQDTSGDLFDNLRITNFAEEDLAVIDNILEGTFVINADVIHSLRKILEKALHSSETNAGLEGVKKVINCLLQTIEQEGRYDWKEIHLQFVMLLRLCLNFISIIANDSEAFLDLTFKLLGIIKISSAKSEDMKNTMVKALSTSMIDFILNNNTQLLLRRNVTKIFNNVLSGSNRNLRREISVAIRDQLDKLTELLLNCGDYEFQTVILELIFRFVILKSDRKQFKTSFSQYPEIKNAFISMSFKDFDPDSRTFLNIVNSVLGEKREVFTYRCVKAFVDDREIFKPQDENYKEFWVDFSLGSNCINILCDGSSFTTEGVGNFWELICIPSALVTRTYLKPGNVMKGVSDNMHTLVLETVEVSDQSKKDIYLNPYPSNARKFEIIFDDTKAIDCLVQKILPKLFGNKFEGLVETVEAHTVRNSSVIASSVILCPQLNVANEEMSQHNETSNLSVTSLSVEHLHDVANCGRILPSLINKGFENSKVTERKIMKQTKYWSSNSEPVFRINNKPSFNTCTAQKSKMSATTRIHITRINQIDPKLLKKSSTTDRLEFPQRPFKSGTEQSVNISMTGIEKFGNETRVTDQESNNLSLSITSKTHNVNQGSDLNAFSEENNTNQIISKKDSVTDINKTLQEPKILEKSSEDISVDKITTEEMRVTDKNSVILRPRPFFKVSRAGNSTDTVKQERYSQNLNKLSSRSPRKNIVLESSESSEGLNGEAKQEQCQGNLKELFKKNKFSIAQKLVIKSRKNTVKSNEILDTIGVEGSNDSAKQKTWSENLNKLSRRETKFSTATTTVEKSRKNNILKSSESSERLRLESSNNTIDQQSYSRNLLKQSKTNDIVSTTKIAIRRTSKNEVVPGSSEYSENLRIEESNDNCEKQICSENMQKQFKSYSVTKAVTEEPRCNVVPESSESPELVGLNEDSVNDTGEQQNHSDILVNHSKLNRSIFVVKSNNESSYEVPITESKLSNLSKIANVNELLEEENTSMTFKPNSLHRNVSECEITADSTEINTDELLLNAGDNNTNSDKEFISSLNDANKRKDSNNELNKEMEFTETCAVISKNISQNIIDDEEDIFGKDGGKKLSGNSVEMLLRILDSQESIKNKESDSLGNGIVAAKDQIIKSNTNSKGNVIKCGTHKQDQTERISDGPSGPISVKNIICTQGVQDIHNKINTQDSYEQIKDIKECNSFKGFDDKEKLDNKTEREHKLQQNKQIVNGYSIKEAESEVRKSKRLAQRRLRSDIRSKKKLIESESHNLDPKRKKKILHTNADKGHLHSAQEKLKTLTRSKEKQSVSESENDFDIRIKKKNLIPNADYQNVTQNLRTPTRTKENQNDSELKKDSPTRKEKHNSSYKAVLIHPQSAEKKIQGQLGKNKKVDVSISQENKETASKIVINKDVVKEINDFASQRNSGGSSKGKYASIAVENNLNCTVKLRRLLIPNNERLEDLKILSNKSSKYQGCDLQNVENMNNTNEMTAGKSINEIAKNVTNEFDKDDVLQSFDEENSTFDIETAATQILQPQGVRFAAETLTALPINESKMTEETHLLKDKVEELNKHPTKNNFSLSKDTEIDKVRSNESEKRLEVVTEHILKDWESVEDLESENNKANDHNNRALSKNMKTHCESSCGGGGDNGMVGMATNKKKTEKDKKFHKNDLIEIPSCTKRNIKARTESVNLTKKNEFPEKEVKTSTGITKQIGQLTHLNMTGKILNTVVETDVEKLKSVNSTQEGDSSYRQNGDQVLKSPTRMETSKISKMDNSFCKSDAPQVSGNLEVNRNKTNVIVEQILQDWDIPEKIDENNKSKDQNFSTKLQPRTAFKDLEMETLSSLQQNSNNNDCEMGKIHNRETNKTHVGGGGNSNVNHLYVSRTSEKCNSKNSLKINEIKSLMDLKMKKKQDINGKIRKSGARIVSGLETPIYECTDQTGNFDDTKPSSRKRKLYSETNSPELIEAEDYDDSVCDPMWTPKCPIAWRPKRLLKGKKINVNKAGCECKRSRKLKTDTKVDTEISSINFEITNLGQLGEFSPKSTSRWKSKYLNDKQKNKSKRDSQDKKGVSIYSDFGSESDSNCSWLFSTKSKFSKIRRPKITYEKKNKALFPKKQMKKQTFSSNKFEKKVANTKILNLHKEAPKTYVENLSSDDSRVLRNGEDNFDDGAVHHEMNILHRRENINSSDNESLPSLIVETVKTPVYIGKYSPLYLSDKEDEAVTFNKNNVDDKIIKNTSINSPAEISNDKVNETQSKSKARDKIETNDKTNMDKESTQGTLSIVSSKSSQKKEILTKEKKTTFNQKEDCKNRHMKGDRPCIRGLDLDDELCNSQDKIPHKHKESSHKSESHVVLKPHSKEINDSFKDFASPRHQSKKLEKLRQTNNTRKQKRKLKQNNHESLMESRKKRIDICGGSVNEAQEKCDIYKGSKRSCNTSLLKQKKIYKSLEAEKNNSHESLMIAQKERGSSKRDSLDSLAGTQIDVAYESIVPNSNIDKLTDTFEEFVREFTDSFENEDNSFKTMKLNNDKSDNRTGLILTEIKKRKSKKKLNSSQQVKTHLPKSPVNTETIDYLENIRIPQPEIDVPEPIVSFYNESDTSLFASPGKTSTHQINSSKDLCHVKNSHNYFNNSQDEENNICTMNPDSEIESSDKKGNRSTMGTLTSNNVTDNFNVSQFSTRKNVQNLNMCSPILSSEGGKNVDSVQRNTFRFSNPENITISRCIESNILSSTLDKPGRKVLNYPDYLSSSPKRRKKLTKANTLKEIPQNNINFLLNISSETEGCSVDNNAVLDHDRIKKIFSHSEVEKSDLNLLTLDSTFPSSAKNKGIIAKSAEIHISSQEKLSDDLNLNNKFRNVGINYENISGNSKKRKNHKSFWKDTETNHNVEESNLEVSSYPTGNMTLVPDTEDVELLNMGSNHTAEYTEINEKFEFTTASSWTVMESRKMKIEEYFRTFFEETGHIIENNFMKNFTRGKKRRQDSVIGYLKNEENELKNLENNIEFWNEQEARLRKLERYIKHTFSLCRKNAEDVMQSKFQLQDIQECFNKEWKKVEKEQKTSLSKLNEDLKNQLDALVKKRISDDISTDIEKLKFRMKGILDFMAEPE